MNTSNQNVTILLCTKNGGRFLEEQLNSYRHQTHKNWRLVVSDDGSTDNTVEIVNRFAKEISNPVEIRSGPRQGFVQNFLSLLQDPTIEASYFAYSDQDDIWLPNKLERALLWHESVEQEHPALYCGRVRLMSEDGRELGLSPLFSKPAAFENALVENIASGNTSVLNAAARRILCHAGMPSVPLHDWWTYQVVTACGGRVWYDPAPCLRYRQHKDNVIGMNHGLSACIRRGWRLYHGDFKANIDLNIRQLENLGPSLVSSEARKVLAHFKNMKTAPTATRMARFWESGIYRQNGFENVGLMAAVLFKRI